MVKLEFDKKSNSIKFLSPGMVVLVGAPGTAKSNLAKEMAETFKNWEVINQMELGTRYDCIKAAHKAITEGKNVIIDRCNINIKQRQIWIRLAKARQIPVDCLELRLPYKILEDRLLERETHPRGLVGTRALEVLSKFTENFEQPKVQEGFNRVVVLPPALQQGYIFGPNALKWLVDAFSIKLYYIECNSKKPIKQYHQQQGSKSMWKETGYISQNWRTATNQNIPRQTNRNTFNPLVSNKNIFDVLNNLNYKEVTNNSCLSNQIPASPKIRSTSKTLPKNKQTSLTPFMMAMTNNPSSFKKTTSTASNYQTKNTTEVKYKNKSSKSTSSNDDTVLTCPELTNKSSIMSMSASSTELSTSDHIHRTNYNPEIENYDEYITISSSETIFPNLLNDLESEYSEDDNYSVCTDQVIDLLDQLSITQL